MSDDKELDAGGDDADTPDSLEVGDPADAQSDDADRGDGKTAL